MNAAAARLSPRVAAPILRPASPAEMANWDGLIASFPHSVYHTRAWLRSIEEFGGAAPLHLVCERGGEIVACVPGFLVRLGPLRIYASPREGWQTEFLGPAFDPRRISTSELFAQLVPYLESRHGVCHMELASPHLDGAEMESLGFQGKSLFTYRAPLLPHDPEQAIRALDKKTRNQLRKAMKVGLTVRDEAGPEFVDEFLAQCREVFGRRGHTVPFRRERVMALVRHMGSAGRLLALSVHEPQSNACIATGIFLIEGADLVLWGWTHRSAYGSLCPIELLTWTAMERAIEAGCSCFEMSGGGAGKPKFGGVPFEGNRRWMRSRYSWLASARKAAASLYRWQQAFRGARWKGSA